VPLPRQTSWTDLVRRFRALGWDGPLYGGKHPFMVKGTRKQRIPNPHQGDIGAPLLRELLRQAGIAVDEWNRPD
jgi:predicted RNA binding protein YcfA (HicA-like mRNA interferase family)